MTVALIVAAGSGERLGADVPKALVQLGGRSMLEWCVQALAAVPAIEQIVVALPPGVSAPPGARGVPGGAVRSQSVRLALQACADGDPVLVHDAARPLLTRELAESVLAALARDGDADAAIAAVPVTDTVKRADPHTRVVSETLARSELWAVQTPQVFRRSALQRALSVAPGVLARATDDAWLVERAGGRVIVVPSSERNIKVTTPLDLQLAELLLAARPASDDGSPAANPA
jgi:2-C-methyl-D-erythritol 4-phosphate cytidylyltransferase